MNKRVEEINEEIVMRRIGNHIVYVKVSKGEKCEGSDGWNKMVILKRN